jgi:hypothetical protein
MGKVPDTPDSTASCICGNCPSKADDGMSLYCTKGKSTKVVKRGFCACKWCPLWSGYGLENDVYCAEGTE